MPDLTFPQLNANQGTNTADALLNRANAAADLLCDAYQNYPGALLPGTIDLLGVIAFTDGLLGGLCAPRGKVPPVPSPPFAGGQCEALYTLFATRTDSGGSQTFNNGNGFGKLSNYRTGTVNTPLGTEPAIFVDQGVGTPNERLNILLANGRTTVGGGNPTFSFNPVLANGQPDNCGSLPPSYPPVVPPPEAYQRDAPITQYNTPITVPVVLIPVTFLPGAIQFRPEFNIDVGGVNVNFDLGGVNFSIGKPGGSTPKLPGTDPRTPALPPSQPNSPLAKCEPYNDTKLVCRIKKLQEELLNDGYDFINGSTAIAQSGTFSEVTGRFFRATVLVTQKPANLRIQSSTAPAKDVWYVGWFSWLEGTRPIERQYIHFQEQTYIAPERATGFVYQLYAGCLGTTAWTRRIPKAFVDRC